MTILKMKIYKRLFHGTCPSLIKQLLQISFFDSSLFKHTSKINQLSLSPDSPVDIETILKYPKRYQKKVYKWITGNSLTVTKSPLLRLGYLARKLDNIPQTVN